MQAQVHNGQNYAIVESVIYVAKIKVPEETTARYVRPLRGGQITIPAEFRQRLGIEADSVLRVTLVDGELHISPMQVTKQAAGSLWLKELYDEFAAVRQDASRFTEAEVDQAIDDAVAAVRRGRA